MSTPSAKDDVATVRRFLERSDSAMVRRTEARAAHLRSLVPALAKDLRALGATRVWVFGSLVWGGLHPESDLDLAVLGLPPGRLIEAYDLLWQRVGVPVDLVALETCAPELRARILATGEEVSPP